MGGIVWQIIINPVVLALDIRINVELKLFQFKLLCFIQKIKLMIKHGVWLTFI